MRQPRVFHLIQRAHSALFRAADQALKRDYGITAAQQAVLFTLMLQDGRAITQIASSLRMGNSSVTGLIDRMEKHGLVKRQRSVADGRSWNVYILPKGRDIVEATLSNTKRINSALLKPFNADERAIIERFLTHVSDHSADIIHAQTHAALKEKDRV